MATSCDVVCAQRTTLESRLKAQERAKERKERARAKREGPLLLLLSTQKNCWPNLDKGWHRKRERKRDGKCRYEGPFRFLLSIVQTF